MVQVNCSLEDCIHNRHQYCEFNGTILLEQEFNDRILVRCDEWDNGE
jgi:hypothetical protein